jgi:glycosyltransferase involved in cell wall biosynthesis
MKERLWVVSEVYYPEETSTGYYMTAIAEGLAESFDVNVLCGQPNYSARGIRAPKWERHNGTSIYRVRGTTLNKNFLPFRITNMLTLGVSVFFTAVRRFVRGDKIIVVTTPPNLPFIAAAASLAKGASYCLLIHDRYPDELVAIGMLKSDSFAVRSIDFLNRWLYKHASKMIVVGRDMKELVERKSIGLDARVKFIPNWAEIDDVKPRPREESELLRDLNLEDKLVVLHAGNIGHPTDVETVIEALRRIKDKDIHFIFLGSGVKLKKLEAAKSQYQLQNLTLLPPRPRTEQIEFLNSCDVGLVSLVNGMFGAAMPSKTYNIMAAGKPILALTEEGSELARVIDEDDIGWHIPPGNAGALVDALDAILQERDTLVQKGERARDAAVRKYSEKDAINNYAREIRRW